MMWALIDGDAKKATEECDCTDTTRGVFKAYAFFFCCGMGASNLNSMGLTNFRW